MKFLCVSCDEAMKLQQTAGPDQGSMTVIFACPACGRQIAMLTNAMETQMVRALDVKIGGHSVTDEPMGMVRRSLMTKAPDVSASVVESDPAPAQAPQSGKKCPFTSTVSEAFARQAEKKAPPTWTAEAQQRLDRIPSFVRPMVKQGIEQFAVEKGLDKIDERVMEEVKERFGM